MKKFVVLALVFGLGFGTKMIVDSRIDSVSTLAMLGARVAGVSVDAPDQFISHVDYDGKRFTPGKVTIKKGNYLAIMNKSKTALMWLMSDSADLTTQRGYGEGEVLQTTLLTIGNFKVMDKNTKAYLSVKVE